MSFSRKENNRKSRTPEDDLFRLKLFSYHHLNKNLHSSRCFFSISWYIWKWGYDRWNFSWLYAAATNNHRPGQQFHQRTAVDSVECREIPHQKWIFVSLLLSVTRKKRSSGMIEWLEKTQQIHQFSSLGKLFRGGMKNSDSCLFVYARITAFCSLIFLKFNTKFSDSLAQTPAN